MVMVAKEGIEEFHLFVCSLVYCGFFNCMIVLLEDDNMIDTTIVIRRGGRGRGKG